MTKKQQTQKKIIYKILTNTKVTKSVEKLKAWQHRLKGELPDSKIEDNRRSISSNPYYLDLTFYVSESSMPVVYVI